MSRTDPIPAELVERFREAGSKAWREAEYDGIDAFAEALARAYLDGQREQSEVDARALEAAAQRSDEDRERMTPNGEAWKITWEVAFHLRHEAKAIRRAAAERCEGEKETQ